MAGYYDNGEEIDLDIALLKTETDSIQKEIKQIEDILHHNLQFAEYITNLKLMVQGNNDEIIPVTRKTLVGFEDNINFLSARQKLLAADFEEKNNQISYLTNQKKTELRETPQEEERTAVRREYKMVEKKTKRRQLVLQPSLDAWVEEEAKRKGLSVNGYIHRVLEEKFFAKEVKKIKE